MQSIPSYFPDKSYPEELKYVNGIAFTDREVDIISMVLSGKSSGTISNYLYISSKTVENHIHNILQKLGYNSREKIINFVEQTGTFNAFHYHYQKLLLEHLFLSSLQKIAGLIKKEDVKCRIIFQESVSGKEDFLKQLTLHLWQAGVIATIATKVENSNNGTAQYIILNLSLEAQNQHGAQNVINLVQQESYYHVVFAILGKLIISPDIKDINTHWQEQYMAAKQGLKPSPSSQNIKLTNDTPSKTKMLHPALFLTFICFIGILGYLYFNFGSFGTTEHTKQPIRSDLTIPIKTAFLERPAIIERMNDRLKAKDGIKTIALTGIIGIGGAGKTTIARAYGKSIPHASIVWELNAETKDTLLNSLRDLAYVLAGTVELKAELDSIESTQNPEIQETLLLNFIKKNLKERSNWVLIYDNMESFYGLDHLFPHDSDMWGNGKVIITTRNEHIAETSYIRPEDVIHVNELSQLEMLTLFSKILYDSLPDNLTEEKREKSMAFLKNIPPFPLDVSVAAYSIKNTKVTFEQYLKHINDYSTNYEAMQLRLLKEVTSYTKTRYGIISSTIEKLGHVGPHFKELFFFICFLDSQNIPYALLKNYKNTEALDSLIYDLRRNGLLVRKAYSALEEQNKTISIHRSTQEIGAAYLISSTTKEEQWRFTNDIILALSNFYQDLVKNKDTNGIILLIPHLTAALNMMQNVDIAPTIKNKYEAELCIMLGQANYKYARNLTLARDYFKKALNKIGDSQDFSKDTLAKLLKDLGNASVTANHLIEAVEYCSKSIAICKTLPNSEILVSDNLQVIGSAYRKSNNFEKARDYLEQALKIIPKPKYEEKKELIAEIYTQLGMLYLTNYMNKKEAEIAKEYDGEALKMLYGFELFKSQSKALPSAMTCSAARYRWKYSQVFLIHYWDYETTKTWLEEAEYIMQHKCPEDMYLRGRISGTLGEVLLRTNHLVDADARLTESINLISIVLGAPSTWFENTHRAEVRIRLGKFNDAYKDCMHVLNLTSIEKNNLHDLVHWTAMYHAAVAQYRLGNYKKALWHFDELFKNMGSFCKGFLDNERYGTLAKSGAFTLLPYSKSTEIANIKIYLDHSLEIFKAIYGPHHSFIENYAAKNVKNNE